MRNALTIDLEDYYHTTALSESVGVAEWDTQEARVEGNTRKVLELLAKHDCRGTFFVLGWVGERYPHLIREVANAGHEIGCHSLLHRLVYQMSPAQFREDTRRAKAVLEDASGQAVRGYRAPSFSITQESLWAFEVLAELGFVYDSSIFPVHHPNYGMPQAPRLPFCIRTTSGNLIEFPMTTLRLGRRSSPFAGGAYLRLLPYAYTRWGIRYLNEREGVPACVYVHPWELDSQQPRVRAGFTARARHYLGLRSVESKLCRLLMDFEFAPLGSLVSDFEEHSLPVADLGRPSGLA